MAMADCLIEVLLQYLLCIIISGVLIQLWVYKYLSSRSGEVCTAVWEPEARFSELFSLNGSYAKREEQEIDFPSLI